MIFFLGTNIMASAQLTTPSSLEVADSLFQQKQYTQSLEHYTSILRNDRQYTPSMLLKMAFIQEGLGHLSQSMYCLNLYYLITHDEHTLQKMEEIAVKNKLTGYESSDVTKALFLLKENRLSITLVLLALCVFLFSITIYQRRKNVKPLTAFIFLAFVLVVLVLYSNINLIRESAILTSSQTYLMSGPSAGSSVIAIVKEGHKVEVHGKKDVWMKVIWNDREVYVKEDDLLPIRL
ncbi:MAG: SH3 domain-containing protein [Flammeovirgaceae bacterium]|nr:SH3 domain-containing protein [Flammeovirgaceae bacterium]